MTKINLMPYCTDNGITEYRNSLLITVWTCHCESWNRP